MEKLNHIHGIGKDVSRLVNIYKYLIQKYDKRRIIFSGRKKTINEFQISSTFLLNSSMSL